MALLPFSYNARSLLVRRAATSLTILGIAATVAVLAAVLALKQGFERLFTENGRDDVFVFLRPGSTSETDSAFPRDRADIILKSIPEIASLPDGRPAASLECFLALRMRKFDGGETNVPIRGVGPATFDLSRNALKIVEGRAFEAGSDEVIVGSKLVGRVPGCALGQDLLINVTPFKVVGVFDCEGPYASEIWGDVERIKAVLRRPGYSRILARLDPDVDLAEFAARMEDHPQAPAKVMTEREYLTSVTAQLSNTLRILGTFLATVMGLAAVFTATNTMLAALAARTREIGILRAIGFGAGPIFVSFLLEALLLGAIGGLVGALLTLPLDGIETGTTNFQTFTEVAFAFRVTPGVLLEAMAFALCLGLFGGAWPAFRAARLPPSEAMRRR